MGESKSPEEKWYDKQEKDCESILTDGDMIRIHIDIALRNGDKEAFMKLVGQLKEVAE